MKGRHDAMRVRFQVLGILGAACAGLLVTGLGGCSESKKGPKRTDHEAAHTRRYHPQVERVDATGTVAPVAETGPARAVTRPEDIDFSAGPVGCPVLFVNNKTLSVPEVLEPILDELQEKARSMSLAAYRSFLFRTLNNQVDYQISLLVIEEEAAREFKAEGMQKALDKEADRRVKDMILRRFGGVDARYEAHLKSLNLTRDEIKARAKRQVMVQQFLQQRFRPMVYEPTRRELQRYYESHPEEFNNPARAELHLIEMPLEEILGQPIGRASADEKAAAVAKAREALQPALDELAGGADFAEVARKYSKGVRARTGGNWGSITPGSLTGRWARAAEVLFTLQSGQISPLIEADDAVMIVKCGESVPAQSLSFEQAQEKILEKLMEEDFNRRRDAYVNQLVGRAAIRKRQEFLQALLAASPKPAELTGTSP